MPFDHVTRIYSVYVRQCSLEYSASVAGQPKWTHQVLPLFATHLQARHTNPTESLFSVQWQPKETGKLAEIWLAFFGARNVCSPQLQMAFKYIFGHFLLKCTSRKSDQMGSLLIMIENSHTFAHPFFYVKCCFTKTHFECFLF